MPEVKRGAPVTKPASAESIVAKPRPNPLAFMLGLIGWGATRPVELAAAPRRRRSGGPPSRVLNQRQKRIRDRRAGRFSVKKRRNK